MYADDMSDPEGDENGDELQRYLSTEPDRNVKNPIVWWHQNAHVYPRLSVMARDFLSIPGKQSIHLSNVRF